MTRPWQTTIDFVDGLKGKLPDEELAVIKRCVEKRSREAALAQVTVTPVDTVQYCSPCSPDPDPSPQMHVLIWRTLRVRWVRSWRSLNHHQLVRVSKRPDSSVPQTRRYGSKDKLPPTASLPRAWIQAEGEEFLLRRNARTRKRLQTPLRQLLPQKTAGARNPEANRTSSSTPVGKERRPRLRTRL